MELWDSSGVGLPAMMALVSKPGMQEVELWGVAGAEEHEERLQQVARRLGVRLSVHSRGATYLYDLYEEDDLSEDGSYA